MERLDVFLALVLTLASLATVVTILVEAGQRFLYVRSRGLKKMLEAYFDDVLLRAKADPSLRKGMVDDLLKSPLFDRIVTGKIGRFLAPLARPAALTFQTIMRRLEVSEPFNKMLIAAKADKDALEKELSAKYDEFSAAMSDYFKRRAQVTSMIVGLLLALFANIHGLRIYEEFRSDPVVRERVILKMEDIEKKVNAPAEKPQAKAASGTAAGGDAGMGELKAEIANVKSELSHLSGMGIPIGWKYYPNCLQSDEVQDPACTAFQKKRMDVCLEQSKEDPCKTVRGSVWATAKLDFRRALKWLFVVLITGVLLGLGGPFWFDVAKWLGQIKNATRSGAPPADGQASAGSAEAKKA